MERGRLEIEVITEFTSFYVFFWVIPRRLNFVFRCLGTPCLFHLHGRVGMKLE